MGSIFPKNRPNCTQILSLMNDWELKKEEIKALKVFDNFEKQLSDENPFFIDFMKSKHKNLKHK